uniref:Little elongation complex subunit 2 C-terminal domain-containing protein n=1 Tax=Hucho hucho TaxID=62062 RepID=A0A4W5K9N5_9TELE
SLLYSLPSLLSSTLSLLYSLPSLLSSTLSLPSPLSLPSLLSLLYSLPSLSSTLSTLLYSPLLSPLLSLSNLLPLSPLSPLSTLFSLYSTLLSPLSPLCRPAKSLNILHHLLKKITGLSEGHYLIGHKAGEPFVTIFKAAEGRRIVREAYDLQQTHSSVPPPSSLGPVPWVPLDHTLVLPFHQKHSRPPCTFPPPDLQHGHKARKGGAGEPGKPGPSKGKAGPANPNPASSQGAKKKKNKGKRTQRRDKWMKRQIQRSIQQNSP